MVFGGFWRLWTPVLEEDPDLFDFLLVNASHATDEIYASGLSLEEHMARPRKYAEEFAKLKPFKPFCAMDIVGTMQGDARVALLKTLNRVKREILAPRYGENPSGSYLGIQWQIARAKGEEAAKLEEQLDAYLNGSIEKANTIDAPLDQKRGWLNLLGSLSPFNSRWLSIPMALAVLAAFFFALKTTQPKYERASLAELRQMLTQPEHHFYRSAILQQIAAQQVATVVSKKQIAAIIAYVQDPCMITVTGQIFQPGDPLVLDGIAGHIIHIGREQVTLQGLTGIETLSFDPFKLFRAENPYAYPVTFYPSPGAAQAVVQAIAQMAGIAYIDEIFGGLAGYSEAQNYRELLLEISPSLGLEIDGNTLHMTSMPMKLRAYIGYSKSYAGLRPHSLSELLGEYSRMTGMDIRLSGADIDGLAPAAVQFPEMTASLSLQLEDYDARSKRLTIRRDL